MVALDALFHARSVALLGISADPKKMTGAPIEVLKQTGFAGKIYPVNPKYSEISGITCYASMDALPEQVDVALIMLAACPRNLRWRQISRRATRPRPD